MVKVQKENVMNGLVIHYSVLYQMMDDIDAKVRTYPAEDILKQKKNLLRRIIMKKKSSFTFFALVLLQVLHFRCANT